MNDVTGPQASYGMGYILLHRVWREHIEMFPKRELKTPENTEFKQNAHFKTSQFRKWFASSVSAWCPRNIVL